MLSKPNVNDMIGKVGNRYEVAIAVAKRARAITENRIKDGDKNIKDPVDVATTEIFENKSIVTFGKIKEDVIVDEKLSPEDEKAAIEETVIEDPEEIIQEVVVVKQDKKARKPRSKKTDE